MDKPKIQSTQAGGRYVKSEDLLKSDAATRQRKCVIQLLAQKLTRAIPPSSWGTLDTINQSLQKRNKELEECLTMFGAKEVDVLRARIKKLEALRDATCLWREETDGEYWSTECGQAHIFTADGPRENSHTFCPYCRGRLIAVAEDGKREMF